jgi:hypothetical protein
MTLPGVELTPALPPTIGVTPCPPLPLALITAYTSCIANENASHVKLIAPLDRFRTISRISLSGKLAFPRNVTAFSVVTIPDLFTSKLEKCFSYFALSLSVIGLLGTFKIDGDPPDTNVDDAVGVLDANPRFFFISSSSNASFAKDSTLFNPSRSRISPVPFVPSRHTFESTASGSPEGRRNATAFCPFTHSFPSRIRTKSASNSAEEERVWTKD